MSRIILNGIVSSDDDKPMYEYFDMQAFCPAQLRQAIADTKTGDTLTIEVNSPGGNAFAGTEMYSILTAAPCATRAIIQSYAASAASIFVLGATSVLSTVGAQLMLHRPSVSAAGNIDDHQKAIQMLESTTDAMLDIYFDKCKKKTTRSELKAIMHAETWLTAERCIELGLIDGVYRPENMEGYDVAAAFGLPNIATLRDAYQKSKQSSGDWKATATLEIEKNRFI
ncbi:MAG: Clp protease ClpP [Angelakisella sp.]